MASGPDTTPTPEMVVEPEMVRVINPTPAAVTEPIQGKLELKIRKNLPLEPEKVEPETAKLNQLQKLIQLTGAKVLKKYLTSQKT